MARPASVADRSMATPSRIEARVGETGHLFGSVTNRDIAEQLNAPGRRRSRFAHRAARRADPRNRRAAR